MWLLLIMSLRWWDVDVESDIEMRCWWCWKCVEMKHVVYVRDGVHWPCRMSLVGENKVVKEFKHLWGNDLGSLIHSWSVYLMVAHILYVVCCVCSWGVHWPCRMSLVGENRVVKEFKHLRGGCLRIFNSSMVSVLDGAHVSYVVCCVCTWGVHWPCWISLVGEMQWLKSFMHLWKGMTWNL